MTATTHAQMRANIQAQLEQLRSDLQKQQTYVDNAYTNRTTITAQLQATKLRRDELLSQLRTAQVEATKAGAARDLSAGTPVESERSEAHERARAQVAAIRIGIQALAETDEANHALMDTNETRLTEAVKALASIQERVDLAEILYQEVDAQHCEELNAQALAVLQDAKRRRDEAKQHLAALEAEVAEAQEQLVETLAEWPTAARQTLLEQGEFPPDIEITLLEEKLEFNLKLEECMGQADRSLIPFLSINPPLWHFADYKESRAQQRARSHNPAIAGGIDSALWAYDSQMTILEGEIQTRRAKRHQDAAHNMAYQAAIQKETTNAR